MWERFPHLKESESRFLPSDRRLVASHKLCEDAGVPRERQRLDVDLSETQIDRFLSPYSPWVNRARKIFADAHRAFLDGSYTLILTNEYARILEVYSAPEVVRGCHGIGLRAGASLAERESGTNAVALALRYREPVILRGAQHFCRMFNDWYCVAVPVARADGRVVGCVDLSAGHEVDAGEKLSLVMQLAARLGTIMDELNGDRHPSRIIDLDSSRPLSSRQHAILSLVARGHVGKEIAARLGVSRRTVESHLEKLRKRFGAKTTTELLMKLRRDSVSH